MSLERFSEATTGNGNSLHRNTWGLVFVALVLVVVLVMRLFYIQVVQYVHYVSKSDAIRIKRETIEAPRGIIYDRNGNVLAENQMSYSITFDPFQLDRVDESIPRLQVLVPEMREYMAAENTDAGIVETVRSRTRGSRNPEKILRDVDFRLLSIVEEHSNELPGVGSVFEQRRHYPYDDYASHVIGYMGEPTNTQYQQLRTRGYALGQEIGQMGIERTHEEALKGENGAKFNEMNYLNRILGDTHDVRPIPPVAGTDLTLTLDMRLHEVAKAAFGDTLLGAIVALDPRNGEILLMESFPSFNPNDFTHMMTAEKYTALTTNPDKPLFNRTIQAAYPPGSTFKPLTALAGLRNDIPASTTFNACTGAYYYGRWYRCWKESGHGVLNMTDAIMHSCNVYFYQLGRKLTLDQWHDTGELFGLGEKTGINLFGEEPGLLPGSEWYDNSPVVYSPGMILNLAIGQGENLVTILQLARYTGVIATRGTVTKPHLVRNEATPVDRIGGITAEMFDVVREGMHKVVHDPQGTAKRARVAGYEIGGKTGTAQNPHGPAHKLFVAFGPYEDPTVAVACVVENADDYELSLAVEIVRTVLETYFPLYHEDDDTLAVQYD